jgi:hypothetical protein
MPERCVFRPQSVGAKTAKIYGDLRHKIFQLQSGNARLTGFRYYR